MSSEKERRAAVVERLVFEGIFKNVHRSFIKHLENEEMKLEECDDIIVLSLEG